MLELAECRLPGIEVLLRCGKVRVPENPQRPDGRNIDLRVVVLPALEPSPSQAPLFDLAGGPGMASAPSAGFYATDGRMHRRTRDIVFVDQRGTGESHPLHCPELESISPLQRMYPVEAVRRCRQALEKQADLSQYTTTNSAADLEAVRRALGYDRIDLFGVSYGTRLALAYMRLFPERVRSAAFIGTVPDDAKSPLWHARNAQTTLDAVFADCAQDDACNKAFPALDKQWREVLQAVDKAPTIEGRLKGDKTRIELQRGPFTEAFRAMMTTTPGQRRIPWLVSRMRAGDFRPFLDMIPPGGNGIADGLYLSVTCSEDTAWITPGERAQASSGTFLGTYRVDEQIGACEAWNVPRVKLPTSKPLPDIPVLLFTGERDHATPVAWAHEVASRFPRSRVVPIPAMGHVAIGLSPLECLDVVAADFFARGSVEGVDYSCMEEMSPPPFVLGGDDGDS